MNLAKFTAGANAREMTSKISPSVQFLRKSNVFPSGRQLERTPPVSEVKRTLLLNSTITDDVNKSQSNIEAGQKQNHQLDCTFETLETREENSPPPNKEVSPASNPNVNQQDQQEPDHSNRNVNQQDKEASCISSSTCTVNISADDPDILIRGMVGYQWTPADLNFIKTMKEERKLKELQEELAEKQSLLKKEIQARDMSYASRAEILDNLNKLLPCERLLALGKEVLTKKQSVADMNDLSPKSLFAQIKIADVEIVLEEERAETTELEEKLIKALDLRAKEECAEAENIEQRITEKQKRISWLMYELSTLKSQLEKTEETTHAIKTEVNILKALEKTEANGNEVKKEALQVTPVQRKVQGKMRKKVDEQHRSEVLQVTHINQKVSEVSKFTGNEQNANSQEVSQISTNHRSLGDKSKVDSLEGFKTVKYEDSLEIAHASTTQGNTSKIAKNNKKRGERSTAKVVSRSVKTTRSTSKGQESTEDGGKGNSQVALQGTQHVTKAAKVSKKKNLPERSQASTKPKVQSPTAATVIEHIRGRATAVTLKHSQKVSSKVTTVQDAQTRSNTVHFEESNKHLQSQEIVQLSLSKTSKGLKKTKKADGGSKLTKASQGSTKPKVQAPIAATGIEDIQGRATAVTLKRSQKASSKITTIKDVQTKSNIVHFEESTEIVRISPLKTSKGLRRTRKADGGSKPTQASLSSTKPKVQAPEAATGMKGAGGLAPMEGVRRSKRIASKVTTVK